MAPLVYSDSPFIGYLKVCVTLCSPASVLLIAPSAGDGVFSEQKDGNIVLVDLKTGTNKTLVSGKDVQDVGTPSLTLVSMLTVYNALGTRPPDHLDGVDSIREYGIHSVQDGHREG